MATNELHAGVRAAHLENMASRPLDVLVVGGGITGAGVVLDAALRGLRVGLVERDDFACGTSSRSSKMIHGGLRYLGTGDVRLVREALRERRSIQLRAAHLVRELPMLLPIYGRGPLPWQRAKFGTGLWLYDLLGAWRAGRRHSWLTLAEMTRRVPNIDVDGLVGGLSYADSQADDVRLVLAVLRTALNSGALLANGAQAVALLEDGDRVRGAKVYAEGSGGGEPREYEIEADVVVNATGVWADRLGAAAPGAERFGVLPSKGIHLTVRRDKVGMDSGIAFFPQTGNSNVFIEPWQDDLAFIGTSDDPYDGDVARPEATEAEIARLLHTINGFLREPLVREDVVAAWAGLRPLVGPGEESRRASKDVSRKHSTVESPGMVTLVGGKLTTYREMAEDGLDAAVRQLGRAVPECTTLGVPLEGCANVDSPASTERLATRLRVDRPVARHLLRRYGSQCEVLVEMCRADPDLRDQVHPERPYIAAEVAYAVRYELARDVEDVLARRTRLTLETSDGGAAAAGAVAGMLAAAPG
jgi:glycerol-3-phosphate dehydrogenase